jgi:DNA polymerase-3 subunit alpha
VSESVVKPSTEEWTEAEMLAREKAALGFYVTAHPLTRCKELLAACATARTVTLGSLRDGDEVIVGGMVSQFRNITTKGGRRPGSKLGIVTLEDLEGSVEAIIFPDDLDRFRPLVKPDTVVFIQGEVDKRREEPSLRVRDVVRQSESLSRYAEYVVVSFEGAVATDENLQRVLEVCKNHAGSRPVYLELPTEDGSVVLIRCGAELRVAIDEAFVGEAEAVVGPGQVIPRSAARRAIPVNVRAVGAPADGGGTKSTSAASPAPQTRPPDQAGTTAASAPVRST